MRKNALLFSLSSFLLAAGLAAAPLASQTPTRIASFQGFCGTPPADPATRAAVEKRLAGADPALPKAGSIRIPVAIHLITSGREGVVSRNVVNVLIRNLNAAFAATPFSFYLKKMDKTKNGTWYSGCTDPGIEDALKKRLAYKPAQVLNLYSCKTDGAGYNGVLGYAYYPWSLPESHYLQGIVIHSGTFPTGAGVEGYDNIGITAIHETGHWLGLYHIFEGGCFDKDEVADTPAQASPSFLCDLTRDSCPAGPGLDDVKNYMNYSDDSCLDHFTEGQAERMIEAVRAYRPSLR